jgi:Holliday junction resolvasome RuvABC ATP-dependent DNA helicase subunit
MKRTEIAKLIKEYGTKNSGLTWQKSGYANSAFISKFAVINKHEFNTAYYSVYTAVANPSISYVTVLAFYEDEYILKCGDPYLEGSLTKSTLDSLIETTVKKARKEKSNEFIKALKGAYAQAPKSQSCPFNQKNYAQVDKLCAHVAHFLSDLPEDVLDKLYYKYNEALNTLDGSGISSELQTKFDRYAFKKHILLEGDKGSGKTYAASAWANSQDVEQLFVGGHEQFESIDFLGHYIQQKNGQLIWKDGALSEAFRKAKSGQKTVLILDEILRIPKRELNILISALSPIDAHYVLRTGRALEAKDEIAVEEVIKTPIENLWVIGTTNVGEDYAVESMDEALIDRFKPIRKDTTAVELKNILIKTSEKKGFSVESVDKLMNFYSTMARLKSTNIIQKIVNIRHLNEALELANEESDIQIILDDSKLLWVEREYNGSPNEEQMSAINSAMRKIYG